MSSNKDRAQHPACSHTCDRKDLSCSTSKDSCHRSPFSKAQSKAVQLKASSSAAVCRSSSSIPDIELGAQLLPIQDQSECGRTSAGSVAVL